MGFTTAVLPVLSFYLVAAAITFTPTAAQFACNSTGATCNGLVGYASPNATKLGHITSLFGIKNLRNLLGANGLPPSTPSTHPVAANETLQIPFVCLCRNGTGLPRSHRPAYTVVPGDGLYHIAAEVFAGLAVNNISNVNLIIVGEDLWIPLPCSCDEVGGKRVVHYGYVVPGGATLEEIAQEYNTTQDTLLALNVMLDCALTACTSMVGNNSFDYPFLVSNGTYVFTAGNCVMCTCDAANNWTLQCVPSQVKSNLWTTCPSMQCEGAESLYIGNTTTSSCNRTSCAYAGYSNQTIFTTVSTESTCPVSANNAQKLSLQGWSWSYLLISIHLVVLCSLICGDYSFDCKDYEHRFATMTMARLTGGSLSSELISTSSEWNTVNRVTRSDRSGQPRGRCNFVALVGRNRLSHGSVFRLSHGSVFRHVSSRLSCQRRSSFAVVKNQLSSDYGVESSSYVDESSTMDEHYPTSSMERSLELTEGVKPHVQSVKRELLMLSLPAIAGQAIEPLTQLMETAYIGRLGPVELASAGVSMSIFNIISKLFNIPLLSVATSFVAEDIAKSASRISTSDDGRQHESGNGKPFDGIATRHQLSSVSTALFLAVVIGIVEALALYLGSGFFLTLMGIPPDSSMRSPAKLFLSLRALGAPAVVVSLALQGVFRGFKDTKTPVLCLGKCWVYAVCVGNFCAIFLFPILMYYFRFGVTGAAISTVISQYIVTVSMIWHLSKRAVLLPPKLKNLQFGGYIKSGGFLLGRTLAVLVTMTLGTSMAARQGPVAMAAHQICLQVWLAVSLLTDALAGSGQTLIASSLSKGDYRTLREVTNFVLKIGLLTGVSLAAILGVSFGSLATLFTKDAEVLAVVRTGVLFVSASQPVNALAFIFDGLHYGVSDFPYAACSMMMVGAISSAYLLYIPSVFGLPGVWSGLTLFMALRTAAGYISYPSSMYTACRLRWGESGLYCSSSATQTITACLSSCLNEYRFIYSSHLAISFSIFLMLGSLNLLSRSSASHRHLVSKVYKFAILSENPMTASSGIWG
ncbi:hypothetical protein RHGRI_013281 [Rhododendron griersonianum]|uniref:Protein DETOXIFICATION n=1 Tax=Rhododendron griersonianum TaxID=479676 RepID=A0AAV6K599_9ERIC|nr:hypothetical protein RHGRI_013281 [Rhododendron griersonianum]